MNNHFSSRWPDGPARPLYVAEPAAEPPKPKKKRRVLRTVLLILLCLILAGGLITGAYFGVMYAVEHLLPQPAPMPTDGPESAPPTDGPLPSTPVLQWSPDDLPRGNPNPNVTLEMVREAGTPIAPQTIYETVLPSVVSVSVDHGGRYTSGSGVILTSDGYIITNYHVIEGGISLYITLLSNEQKYEAVLIGYDKEFDLAVLKIGATGLTPAVLADSDLLRVGDSVYAIGNPLGYLYGSMADGIVSSLARQIEIDGSNMTLIQTSVPLNSGNSGGALVDSAGRVTGITVAKITGMRGDTVVEGIGLVIPITDTLPFINHIIHTGHSYRPNLGILCYEAALESTGQRGIMIEETTEGSPAHGLLFPGDLIVAANGIPVTKLPELTRILYTSGVGSEVILTVVRGHKEINVAITLYDRLAQ